MLAVVAIAIRTHLFLRFRVGLVVCVPVPIRITMPIGIIITIGVVDGISICVPVRITVRVPVCIPFQIPVCISVRVPVTIRATRRPVTSYTDRSTGPDSGSANRMSAAPRIGFGRSGASAISAGSRAPVVNDTGPWKTSRLDVSTAPRRYQ